MKIIKRVCLMGLELGFTTFGIVRFFRNPHKGRR
jgi:hypothetical protein